MKTIFYNKKISSILTVLPQNEYNFEDEMIYNDLSEAQNRRLARTMGYEKHRIFKEDSYISAIASFGLNHLFDGKILAKDDIAALILTTTTPDFLMPATSNLIAKAVGLNNDVFCIDTNQQCAGFVNGLFLAFMLLDANLGKKVVLITGDVITRTIPKSNTTSYPLAGDAVCITIIENETNDKSIHFYSKTDTKQADDLLFPDMGFRKLTDSEKSSLSSLKYGKNLKNFNSVFMDGQAVFEYVMQDVSNYIEETLRFAGVKKDELDYCFFHQPNKFMVDKLSQKLGVSSQKAPSNVVTYYGNSNSSTIPVCICHNAKDQMLAREHYCLVAGFGAGLAYSGAILNIGKLDYCEILISNF